MRHAENLALVREIMICGILRDGTEQERAADSGRNYEYEQEMPQDFPTIS
jgi:hypothetical protein